MPSTLVQISKLCENRHISVRTAEGGAIVSNHVSEGPFRIADEAVFTSAEEFAQFARDWFVRQQGAKEG